MKKTTKITTKTPAPAPKAIIAPAPTPKPAPAPAPKAVAPAVKPAVKAPVVPVAVPAPKPVKSAKLVAPKKAAPAPAPAVASVPAKPVVTTITAVIDIGFGNALFIRGEGPGLSWDKGVPVACVADDQWKIALAESARPIIFKFLVNDLSWSAGEDFVVQPGADVTLTPTF